MELEMLSSRTPSPSPNFVGGQEPAKPNAFHIQQEVVENTETIQRLVEWKVKQNELDGREERKSHVSSAVEMWKEIEDYVPERTRPSVPSNADENYHRISLIQICRLPPKKLGRNEVDPAGSDDESLFKAWIALPRKIYTPKPRISSRFISSVQHGCYNFIWGPIRNAFRKATNGVTPSRLMRQDGYAG